MSETQPAPRPLELPESVGEPRSDGLRRLISIVDRLRDPDGCPWDRKQTLESVVPHLLEEAHELVEAVEAGDDEHVVEEAGDLLMGITLLARIAEQERRFDLAAIAEGVSDKLVRRHPHVFGDASADTAEAAVQNWEAIKKQERADKAADDSALAGVPVALPAMQRAGRMSDKARAAGFAWSDARGALDKLAEEIGELREVFEEAEAGTRPPEEFSGEHRARLEHELGDVLIAAGFLGSYLKVEPERATRAALRRFERRFRSMEARLPRPMDACSLEELMALWRAVKSEE